MTWWALYSNPSVGQRSWIVLVYELTLSHWCMYCTWRFRRSTAGFDFVIYFLLVTLRFRTPGVCGPALD